VLLLQQQRLQHTFPQPHKTIDQHLADQLLSAVGGKGSLSASVLQQHGVDEGYAPPMPPDIVLYPQNTQQVRGYIPNLVVVQARTDPLWFFLGSLVQHPCTDHCHMY
jgi:hypothetical protein